MRFKKPILNPFPGERGLALENVSFRIKFKFRLSYLQFEVNEVSLNYLRITGRSLWEACVAADRDLGWAEGFRERPAFPANAVHQYIGLMN